MKKVTIVDSGRIPYTQTSFKATASRADLGLPAPAASDVQDQISILTSQMTSLAKKGDYYQAERIKSLISSTKEDAMKAQKRKEQNERRLIVSDMYQQHKLELSRINVSIQKELEVAFDEYETRVNDINTKAREDRLNTINQYTEAISAGPRPSGQLEQCRSLEKRCSSMNYYQEALQYKKKFEDTRTHEVTRFGHQQKLTKVAKLKSIDEALKRDLSVLKHRLMLAVEVLKGRALTDRDAQILQADIKLRKAL